MRIRCTFPKMCSKEYVHNSLFACFPVSGIISHNVIARFPQWNHFSRKMSTIVLHNALGTYIYMNVQKIKAL